VCLYSIENHLVRKSGSGNSLSAGNKINTHMVKHLLMMHHQIT
jgi:hypothetical protein